MTKIYEIAREVLAEDARIAREAHEARMAAFDKLDAEFARILGTINPAPVTTTEVSPASPGADLCSNPPDAEADGGDFSEVTK